MLSLGCVGGFRIPPEIKDLVWGYLKKVGSLKPKNGHVPGDWSAAFLGVCFPGGMETSDGFFHLTLKLIWTKD